jgi:hypothetical protein
MRAARAIGKAPWSWRKFNRRALPHEGGTGAAKRRRAGAGTPLAESLLGNRYPEGTTIKVSLDGENFTFTG